MGVIDIENIGLSVLENLPKATLVTNKVDLNNIENANCVWHNQQFVDVFKTNIPVNNQLLKSVIESSKLLNQLPNNYFYKTVKIGTFELLTSKNECVKCKLIDTSDYYILYFDVVNGIEAANEDYEQQILNLKDRINELEAYNYKIAHDLRTPIASIKMFVKLLNEEVAAIKSDTPDISSHVSLINTSLNQISGLIENLLVYSMLDNNPIRRVVVNLGDLFSEVFKELVVNTPSQNIIFNVDADYNVRIDKVMFRYVIQQLLVNALKFRNTTKTVEINVSCILLDKELKVSVEDNGVGFEPKDIESVFDLFGKSTHQKVKFEGYGIGLAIVKRVIGFHNGRVKATTTPLKGASICFSLPETLIIS